MGIGGDGNPAGVVGEREVRRIRYWVVMGERREGNGILVCRYRWVENSVVAVAGKI